MGEMIVSKCKEKQEYSRDFFVYCLNPKVAELIEGHTISHYILNTVLPAAFNSQPVVNTVNTQSVHHCEWA